MSEVWKIKKKFEFPAGHRLYGYNGKFNWIHGHGFNVTVELEGSELDHLDLIYDFTNLKFISEWLEKFFDHAFLVNSEDKEMIKVLKKLKSKYYVFENQNPSTENIAKKIYFMIDEYIGNLQNKTHLEDTDPPKITISSVEVWESDKHSARYINNE
jgi:6-pyruvoyltetrahydropterin/6-carboxytetrahydropterin synthase